MGEREEKESEEKARSAPRGPPPSATLVLPLRASPSPPSAGLPEEEVSRGSAPSSMTTAGRSSRASSKALSVTPSPTPTTLAARLSPPWTSSTLSSATDAPSTASEHDDLRKSVH